MVRVQLGEERRSNEEGAEEEEQGAEGKIMYRGSRREPAFAFNKSHCAVNRSCWKPTGF